MITMSYYGTHSSAPRFLLTGLTLLLGLLVAVAALAQEQPRLGSRVVVELQDGARFRGKVRALEDERLVLETPYGRLSLPRRLIRRLVVEGTPAPAPTTPEPATAPPPTTTRPQPVPERAEATDAEATAARSTLAPSQVASGRRPTRRLAFAAPPDFAYALVPDLVERFARLYGVRAVEWSAEPRRQRARFEEHPTGFPQEVEILVADRARALTLLRAGRVDAVLARESGEEPEDLEEHVVALDALVVAVHPDNPVRRLARATLGRILRGEIEDWGEIVRYRAPIRRIVPGPELEAAQLIRQRVLAGGEVAPGTVFVRSPDDLLDELYGTPGAIGLGSLGSLGGVRMVVLAECGILQPPTPFRIRSENYPLSQRIDLYLRADGRDGWEDVFALFLLGPRGEAAMADHQLEPLTIRRAEREEQRRWVDAVLGTRPQVAAVRQQFLELARRARKLTVDFRFETASAELDERAREDVARLALWLEHEGIAPARLVLAGYADSRGPYGANLELARRRAEAVAAALTAIGVPPGEILAFGEEIAVACDTDAYGRHLNRRVEAWVR